MSRARTVSVPLTDRIDGGWQPVPEGMPLALTRPPGVGVKVLRLNGEYLLHAQYRDRLVAANDDVEWLVDQPAGREDFRTILQIATIASALIPGAQFLTPYLAAASVAYNLLVPPTALRQLDQGDAVYSASFGGNQARLDQPIWRTCGVDRITPPFAGQPYFEYDGNNDQYLYAVFALGYGPLDILGEFVGKTPLANFDDVIKHDYLAPGVQPTLAQANVITSLEVAGVELVPGRQAGGQGGYVACQPGRTVKSIGYDVVAEQGLAKPPGEEDHPEVTVSWQIEYAPIDDGGTPLSDWVLLDTGERTMATNTPQRWSFKVDLPSPCRCAVRMARTNLPNSDANARDTIKWGGLRAYLVDTAPLDPNASHYEVVVRASENLSAQSQQNFNLIVQGKCRVWDEADGWNCDIDDFDNYVATRNPADWLADLWTNPVWGEGMPDERVDLQALSDLRPVFAARQDRFDFTFATLTDAWTAGQLIASAGRSRMFRRYGVRTVARDELADIGETAFTGRNTYGPMQLNETKPRGSDPDGIIIEFTSNRLWDTDTIECPCPGVSATDPTSPEYNSASPPMSRPVYRRLDGVKGRTHAKREGLYHAADLMLRQRTASCKTEMQRIAVSVLTPVRFMPMIPGYGQTGDVAFWDPEALVMSLSERPDFSEGAISLTLRRDDGTLTVPVPVTPGPDEWSVTLPAAPDFDLVLDDGLRERPMFLLGAPDAGDEIVKAGSIKNGGKGKNGAQLYDIDFVVDDRRVHLADNRYLPGPGDEQDPILLPSNEPGDGGFARIINLKPPIGGAYANSGGEFATASITFHPNGTATKVSTFDAPADANMLHIWMLFGAVEPSVGALYEIRFTNRPDVYPTFFFVANPDVYGAPPTNPNIGVFDVWQPLDVDRTIGISNDTLTYPPAEPYATGGRAVVQVDIRKIGSTAISASALMALFLY